jgi:hypothetical protein
MGEQLWYVGRYMSGFWVAGGGESDYKDDDSIAWYTAVKAPNRAAAIKKAKPKYYRARKAGDAV